MNWWLVGVGLVCIAVGLYYALKRWVPQRHEKVNE